jgi:hypothetical protein
MQPHCNAEQLQYSCIEPRRVEAAFDGGTVSSDAAALPLGRPTRLELHESQGSSCYHKIRPNAGAIKRLWIDL